MKFVELRLLLERSSGVMFIASSKERKNEAETATDKEMEEVLPSPGECVGVVLEPLGAGRMRVQCADGVIRVCRIRGKLRGKRSWLKPGDVVLVSVWEFQPRKGDIVLKYDAKQVRWLIKHGYIDESWIAE